MILNIIIFVIQNLKFTSNKEEKTSSKLVDLANTKTENQSLMKTSEVEVKETVEESESEERQINESSQLLISTTHVDKNLTDQKEKNHDLTEDRSNSETPENSINETLANNIQDIKEQAVENLENVEKKEEKTTAEVNCVSNITFNGEVITTIETIECSPISTENEEVSRDFQWKSPDNNNNKIPLCTESNLVAESDAKEDVIKTVVTDPLENSDIESVDKEELQESTPELNKSTGSEYDICCTSPESMCAVSETDQCVCSDGSSNSLFIRPDGDVESEPEISEMSHLPADNTSQSSSSSQPVLIGSGDCESSDMKEENLKFHHSKGEICGRYHINAKCIELDTENQEGIEEEHAGIDLEYEVEKNSQQLTDSECMHTEEVNDRDIDKLCQHDNETRLSEKTTSCIGIEADKPSVDDELNKSDESMNDVFNTDVIRSHLDLSYLLESEYEIINMSAVQTESANDGNVMEVEVQVHCDLSGDPIPQAVRTEGMNSSDSVKGNKDNVLENLSSTEIQKPGTNKDRGTDLQLMEEIVSENREVKDAQGTRDFGSKSWLDQVSHTISTLTKRWTKKPQTVQRDSGVDYSSSLESSDSFRQDKPHLPYTAPVRNRTISLDEESHHHHMTSSGTFLKRKGHHQDAEYVSTYKVIIFHFIFHI